METKVKNLNDYMDSKGFIGNKKDYGLEMGDSAQRMGAYCLQYPMPDYTYYIACKLWFGDQFHRHWDNSKWWGYHNNCSRDNTIAMLIALAYHSYSGNPCQNMCNFLCDELIKRGGFYWNYYSIWPNENDQPKLPDWSPIWVFKALKAISNRKKNISLYIYDTQLLAMSIIQLLKSKNDTTDDLNHILALYLRKTVMPTFISKVASFIYKYRKPLDRVKSYFRHSWAPPMEQIYEKFTKVL